MEKKITHGLNPRVVARRPLLEDRVEIAVLCERVVLSFPEIVLGHAVWFIL